MTVILQKKRKTTPTEFWMSERKQLFDKGFKFKIRHERKFICYDWDGSKGKRDVKRLTKGEFMALIEDGTIAQDGNGYRDTRYRMDPNNAKTHLSILKDDKVVATGTAKVHPDDPFIRKVGLVKALSAALYRLNHTDEEIKAGLITLLGDPEELCYQITTSINNITIHVTPDNRGEWIAERLSQYELPYPVTIKLIDK